MVLLSPLSPSPVHFATDTQGTVQLTYLQELGLQSKQAQKAHGHYGHKHTKHSRHARDTAGTLGTVGTLDTADKLDTAGKADSQQINHVWLAGYGASSSATCSYHSGAAAQWSGFSAS